MAKRIHDRRERYYTKRHQRVPNFNIFEHKRIVCAIYHPKLSGCYVGETLNTAYERFIQHLQASRRLRKLQPRKSDSTMLHRAMASMGEKGWNVVVLQKITQRCKHRKPICPCGKADKTNICSKAFKLHSRKAECFWSNCLDSWQSQGGFNQRFGRYLPRARISRHNRKKHTPVRKTKNSELRNLRWNLRYPTYRVVRRFIAHSWKHRIAALARRWQNPTPLDYVFLQPFSTRSLGKMLHILQDCSFHILLMDETLNLPLGADNRLLTHILKCFKKLIMHVLERTI